MVRGLLSWLTLACTCAASACIPLSSSDACREDSECLAEEVCTDVRECARAESAPSWRISWTIDGVAPTSAEPEPCAPIDELELTITSSAESLSYAPLTCSIGSFTFRSLPVAFNTARIEAFLTQGGLSVGRATVNRNDEPEVTIDLEL